MTIPPRFPITAAQIERVTEQFYTAVRRDPVLGPVFAPRVTDWPGHEAKIARFWRNAIPFERSYDGNPMQVHAQVGTITTGHFTHWLSLFDGVLATELPEATADAWSALAHRIGRGLSYGIEAQTGEAIPGLNEG